MIKADATLSIQRIPLDLIQIKEYQQRYPDRLAMYIQKLQEHPSEYPGCVSVKPSDTHAGLFELLDGHHRYCASIMTGRTEMLCVVIEE